MSRIQKNATARKKNRTKKIEQKRVSASKIKNYMHHLHRLRNDFMQRRPHRSFRKTSRRDYARSLQLPGYISFSREVFITLRLHRRVYIQLIGVYSVAVAVLVGVASQDLFNEFSKLFVSDASSSTESLSTAGNALLLLLGSTVGAFSPQLSEAQQLTAGILVVLLWLTVVWLLRNQLAGKHPKVRDALYNAGSPIVATAIVVLLMVVQLMPATLAALGYSALTSNSLFQQGVVPMVVTAIAILMVTLSIYLVTTTIFSLIIITIPGMYPWEAIRAAGDLVVGRRLRILLRFFWMILTVGLVWIIIMMPIIAMSAWAQSSIEAISWVPVVPIFLTLVSSAAVVYAAAYTYLLYRKVIEDDALPA